MTVAHHTLCSGPRLFINMLWCWWLWHTTHCTLASINMLWSLVLTSATHHTLQKFSHYRHAVTLLTYDIHTASRGCLAAGVRGFAWVSRAVRLRETSDLQCACVVHFADDVIRVSIQAFIVLEPRDGGGRDSCHDALHHVLCTLGNFNGLELSQEIRRCYFLVCLCGSDRYPIKILC